VTRREDTSREERASVPFLSFSSFLFLLRRKEGKGSVRCPLSEQTFAVKDFVNNSPLRSDLAPALSFHLFAFPIPRNKLYIYYD
jgi:hypothetical protein